MLTLRLETTRLPSATKWSQSTRSNLVLQDVVVFEPVQRDATVVHRQAQWTWFASPVHQGWLLSVCLPVCLQTSDTSSTLLLLQKNNKGVCM